METSKCGTRSGYNRHYRLHESPCEACRQAHRDYYKLWRQNNPEIVRTMQEKYLETHKEHVAKISREWAKTNPDRIKAAQKKYAQNNPEKMRNKCRARRAKKRENGYSSYSELEMFELYGYNCHICSEPIDLTAPRRNNQEGWEKGLHIDHLLPIAKGGADTIDNVRPAHGICNLKRGLLPSLP